MEASVSAITSGRTAQATDEQPTGTLREARAGHLDGTAVASVIPLGPGRPATDGVRHVPIGRLVTRRTSQETTS